MADKMDKNSTDSRSDSSAADAAADSYTMKQHWKCLAACTLMSLCPFQYGLDFGLIGGLQAMVGFLRVCCPDPSPPDVHTWCDN